MTENSTQAPREAVFAARHVNDANRADAPLFSVVIPVHNAEGTLDRALDSILGQSFGDFEVICAVNACDDESLEIAERRARAHPRVLVLNTDVMGAANARNMGVEAACGRYVVFCDADDVYLETALADMARALEGAQADVLVSFAQGQAVDCSGKAFDCDPHALYMAFLDEPVYAARLGAWLGTRHLFLFRPWAMAYSRELLERSGARFDPRCPTLDAVTFNRACFGAAQTARILDKETYRHIERQGSLSRRRDLGYMHDVAAAFDATFSTRADEAQERAAEAMLAFRMTMHLLRVTAVRPDDVHLGFLSEFIRRPDVRELLFELRSDNLDTNAGVDLTLRCVLKALREGDVNGASQVYRVLAG